MDINKINSMIQNIINEDGDNISLGSLKTLKDISKEIESAKKDFAITIQKSLIDIKSTYVDAVNDNVGRIRLLMLHHVCYVLFKNLFTDPNDDNKISLQGLQLYDEIFNEKWNEDDKE